MCPMKSGERESGNFRYVGAVVQKDKSGQNVTALQHIANSLALDSFRNLGAIGVAVGEMLQF